MVSNKFIILFVSFILFLYLPSSAKDIKLDNLEYDKTRIEKLLKSGYLESECKELIKLLSRYEGKEYLLGIDLNEIFFTVIKNYSSNDSLLELVKRLANSSNINYRDANGFTPLMYVVTFSDKVNIADYLIKNGADVNQIAKSNKPPFFYLNILDDFNNWFGYDYARCLIYNYNYSPLLLASAFNKNPEMVDLLVKSGADKNATDCLERDALELAIYYNGNNEVAKRLIDLGFYKKRKSEYSEPLLILAVLKNDYNLAKTLIDKGTNLSQKASDGNGVLYIAAKYCYNLEMFKLLFESGIDIEEKRVLDIALEKNLNKDVVSFLIDKARKSKRLYLRDKDWYELLLKAIYLNSDYDKIVYKLLEYSSIHRIHLDENTPFWYAVKFYNNYKIYHYFEKEGVDFFERDKNGNNAFMVAVANGRYDLAEALVVVYKYDVNLKNIFNENALFICFDRSSFSDYEIKNLDFLLKMGCDINSTDLNGDTLLIKASREKNSFKFIKHLIEKNANVYLKNNDGENALLSVAKNNGLCNSFIYLLNAGADVNVKDNYGYTVLNSLINSEKNYWYYYILKKRDNYLWNKILHIVKFFKHDYVVEYNQETELDN